MSRLVYSTDFGRACQKCGKPIAQCTCRKQAARAPLDDVVRVRREVKGRKGKTVTTISGVPLNEDGLRELASELNASAEPAARSRVASLSSRVTTAT